MHVRKGIVGGAFISEAKTVKSNIEGQYFIPCSTEERYILLQNWSLFLQLRFFKVWNYLAIQNTLCQSLWRRIKSIYNKNTFFPCSPLNLQKKQTEKKCRREFREHNKVNPIMLTFLCRISSRLEMKTPLCTCPIFKLGSDRGALSQPEKSLKSNTGGGSFCWIGIHYAMPYCQ